MAISNAIDIINTIGSIIGIIVIIKTKYYQH